VDCRHLASVPSGAQNSCTSPPDLATPSLGWR
jgi:hypothetical protein